MTPGPTITRKCTNCLKSILQHTTKSGNTFGATFWSDGKREAPMLPDRPWLVMCPHCHAPLWIDELEIIGKTDIWDWLNDNRAGAIGYKTPTFDDYFALLAKNIVDHKKERYVRVRAWWAGNDERRTSPGEIPMSLCEMENLTSLAEILDESDANSLVMKAEAMRELGRFDDALTLLARSTDGSIAQAVETIRSLSEKRDPYVRRM